MATKTDAERDLAQRPATGNVQLARTDSKMAFTLISESDVLTPESLGVFLDEGFTTQRHVKLQIGKMIRGIFVGMEDGELSARSNGEIPQVKWVYIDTGDNTVVRLLGAYNMISQLKRYPTGSEVIIGRGADYDLPNGLRCTEYFVLGKPPRVPAVPGAAGATVEVSKTA